MCYFGLPQVRTTVAPLVAAAAFTFLAVPAGAAELDDDAPLLGEIQEILSRDGPYSIRLFEPLTSLAALYRSTDDDAFALARLERAVQILRINRGLHTFDQVPLVREIIRLERERGNVEGAWDSNNGPNAQGSPTVRVSILDECVEKLHPDLFPNWAAGLDLDEPPYDDDPSPDDAQTLIAFSLP